MKCLRIPLLLVLAAIGAFAEKKMSAEDFKEALTGDKIFLLDVRDPNELVESGAIEGYINIPLGQLERRMSEVPKNKTVLTLCGHGQRASIAAGMLEKAGYHVLGSCGIASWKERGFKTVQPRH